MVANLKENELLERAKNLLEVDGLTQKDLAKKLDISQTTLSQYLKGEYSGDIDKVNSKLLRFLDYSKNAKKYKKVSLDFVKTSISAKIFNIAQIAQYNGEIALCTGSSGLGKTTAIKQYAKEHTGVIVIDPDENIKVRNLLKLIAKPLKMQQGHIETNMDFCEKILKKLKNSNKLIIVDEAENLDISCFRVLRKIHDRCNGTCGLLFIGTEQLGNKLSSLKSEYMYIYTRFGYIDNLDNLTESDAKSMILQIFPNCEDNLVRLFYKVSMYNARVLFNLLKRVADMVRSSNESLNDKMIKSAGMYVGAAKV